MSSGSPEGCWTSVASSVSVDCAGCFCLIDTSVGMSEFSMRVWSCDWQPHWPLRLYLWLDRYFPGRVIRFFGDGSGGGERGGWPGSSPYWLVCTKWSGLIDTSLPKDTVTLSHYFIYLFTRKEGMGGWISDVYQHWSCRSDGTVDTCPWSFCSDVCNS